MWKHIVCWTTTGTCRQCKELAQTNCRNVHLCIIAWRLNAVSEMLNDIYSVTVHMDWALCLCGRMFVPYWATSIFFSFACKHVAHLHLQFAMEKNVCITQYVAEQWCNIQQETFHLSYMTIGSEDYRYMCNALQSSCALKYKLQCKLASISPMYTCTCMLYEYSNALKFLFSPQTQGKHFPKLHPTRSRVTKSA